MIELKNDSLVFSFPEVHPDAVLKVEFQRTLRIPDDGSDYPLPAGLGPFPLRHVDDFHDRVPAPWMVHGGVMLPMYQSEALWINFTSRGYPFAVKVATGKIDAVTGERLTPGLRRRPQNYVVVPDQPWLDGYCVEKGVIRQFVAMPLGSGYTAEEQITGEAEHGGLQLIAHPIGREAWEAIKRKRRNVVHYDLISCEARESRFDMGLAPGGRMRQQIYADKHALSDWDTQHRGRCFVHLANSLVWRSITGEDPPTTPLTSAEYERRGIPWFNYYREEPVAVSGSGVLSGLESVWKRGKRTGDVPLPDNESVRPGKVVELRRGLREGEVRQGEF